MWHGVPEYLAFVAIVAVVLHLAIRRWIVACVFGAVFCSVANLAHEAWLVNFKVNLGWAPVEFIAGCVLAFPGLAVIGIPFAWLRRKRRSEAP